MVKVKTKIVLVAGARPNFMKVAPIIRALSKREHCFDWSLVHTGQHYDHGMSDVFFHELGIPQPDFHMGAGGGSHAEQTARIMVQFEKYCLGAKPDLVLVVGDVNSTLACSIVAKKMGIKVAHVEAGLRSGDMTMPEEINRIVTDSISDIFFVTESSGVENLAKEGHDTSQIHFVGHVMIDNLLYQLEKLRDADVQSYPTNSLKHSLQNYGVVTLHRPANVDSPQSLAELLLVLSDISSTLPLVFPAHPRTRANVEKFGIQLPSTIHMIDPLPYMEFLNLWSGARVVLTDSGGLQEETTALGIPCITLRDNTERPVTVTHGSNYLAGTKPQDILAAFAVVFRELPGEGEGRLARPIPPMWDGQAAERIVEVLTQC